MSEEQPLHPARLRTLQALARRAAAQPDAVRRLLQPKLPAELPQGVQPAAPPRAAAVTAPAAQPGAPLARLNLHIRTAAAARAEPALPGEAHDPDELPSARAFRKAWARGRTLEQLEQALFRKPANAGPLNSHALVLQTLTLMRDLSPEYLRRFVGAVETLQWLERTPAKGAGDAGKGGRRGARGRTRK
jgi:hypothetical protein